MTTASPPRPDARAAAVHPAPEEATVPTDRYTKIVLTVIAVALTAIAVQPLLSGSPLLDLVRPGTANAQMAAAKYEVTVPKAWGKLINFSNGNLLLEGPEGVLRIVDVEGKPPEYPKIKALVRWQ
jgi:hypothetical protein